MQIWFLSLHNVAASGDRLSGWSSSSPSTEGVWVLVEWRGSPRPVWCAVADAGRVDTMDTAWDVNSPGAGSGGALGRWRRGTFGRQAWHLATSTLVSRGKRGNYGTGLGLVSRLGAVAPRHFCVAGVALGDVHLRFAWQAFRFLAHATLSHTHTHLCHTQLCHTPSLTHNFVTHFLSHTTSTFSHTHISLSHTILSHQPLCHTQLCHTPSFAHNFVTHHLSHTTLSHITLSHHLCHTPSLTHNFVTHFLSHTTSTFTHISLSHTILSHPPLCHTQLCHTPSFTHNFVTHHLSHTSWLHTIFHTHIFVTHHLSYTRLSHTIFHTHLCHTPSFTHIFVTQHLSHTHFGSTPSLPQTLFHKHTHTQLFHTQHCHTPSFTHNFSTQLFTYNLLTHRSSTASLVYPAFPVLLQLCVLIIRRSWLLQDTPMQSDATLSSPRHPSPGRQIAFHVQAAPITTLGYLSALEPWEGFAPTDGVWRAQKWWPVIEIRLKEIAKQSIETQTRWKKYPGKGKGILHWKCHDNGEVFGDEVHEDDDDDDDDDEDDERKMRGRWSRKFRSQTSDNMQRWKSRSEKSQGEEKSRSEKSREEKEWEARRCGCAKR